MGGRWILVGVTVGVGLEAVARRHCGATVVIGAGGVVGIGGNSEILHRDGACNPFGIAGRGFIAGGDDGIGISAYSGRGAGDGVARKRHACAVKTRLCERGILGRDIDGRDGIVKTDVLCEVIGGEFHSVVHRHRHVGSVLTTVFIADSHCVGGVAGCSWGGNHGSHIGGIQRGTRCPSVSGRSRGAGRCGGQHRAAAKADGRRIGLCRHTQLGGDDDVHRRGLGVLAVVLNRHNDFNGLLLITLRIYFASINTLTHKGGCAAAVSGAIQGGCGQVGHCIATVLGRRGDGVESGDHRLGHVVRPGVGDDLSRGIHITGVLVGGCPGHTSLAGNALVKGAGRNSSRWAAGAVIIHGEVGLLGPIGFVIPVTLLGAGERKRGGDGRGGHRLPGVNDILRYSSAADVSVGGRPY